MSDSRRGKAGRLGDETRARINDLKGGWDVADEPSEKGAAKAPGQGEPTAIPADTSARRKGPTKPPPMPGRQKGSTRPPPLPQSRQSSPSQPPPIKRASPAPSQPPPIKRASPAPSQPPPIKRASPPPALPPAAVVSTAGVDDDEPTFLTSHDAPDGLPASPAVLAATGNATGSVRLPDSLPRQSGVMGDIAYLFRVMAKSRSSKVEMVKLAERIANEKETRNLKLLQVAREAIGDDRNDQSLVGRARESLLGIEERRSLHAGRVAAADEKMAALSRHRDERHQLRLQEAEALRSEVDAINASLEPLQTRTGIARKRTTELRKQLSDLDEKIRQQEASLVSVSGPADKAAVHAAIASVRAERDTVAADEPMLAAEIDDLEPKISSLISTRSSLADKIIALDQERELDEVRLKEKEHAVQASRTVETRAVDDQANKRQDALLELGEALHNKPATEAPRVSSIEKHDLEIGTLERRRLELKELMSSVEYLPMIRGGIWLFLAVGLIGAGVFFVLTR